MKFLHKNKVIKKREDRGTQTDFEPVVWTQEALSTDLFAVCRRVSKKMMFKSRIRPQSAKVENNRHMRNKVVYMQR